MDRKERLADCYERAGDFETSIQLRKENLKVYLDTRGPTDKKYLAAKEELAGCYERAGDFETSIQLPKDILNVLGRPMVDIWVQLED